MLKRRVTWVHTGGYPFYRVWHEGATQSVEWPTHGTYGFKNLTQHINLYDVTCHPPGSETEQVLLNTHAEYTLTHGWHNVTLAYEVERGRPLKGSDFKNYTILPIWGVEDTYMTGAVIAFVKPSERALPSDCRGFGAYVHIGTRKTFASGGGETDGDYYRGYVGAAVAIWTEVQACEPATVNREYTDVGYTGWGIAVTPVVSYYSRQGEWFEVGVDFGVYGCMKTNIGKAMGKVGFHLGYLPDDCQVMMLTNRSKNGYKYDKPTLGVDWVTLGKTGAKVLLFIIGVKATGGLVYLVHGINGVMLFSDFLPLGSTITDTTNGVDEIQPPDNYVDFKYNPPKSYTQPGDGYTYGEFQSIIHIQLRLNITNRKQWNIVPMQWRITMEDAEGNFAAWINGDNSIAVFNGFDKSNYKTTVFFDDFSGDMNDWRVGDANPSAGYDHWGIVRTVSPGCTAYCAAAGDNSIYGGTNLEKRRYDKCMNAYMERRVDLRPYRTVTLRFHLFYVISPGDYLAVEYYQSGAWITNKSLTGSVGEDHWKETAIPTTAEKIRFRFYSNDDNDVGWGAFINHIEIVAEMPNDADTMADAGDGFEYAAFVYHPHSYGGYLNYDEDWYKFDVTTQNIADGKQIYISMQQPVYACFRMELRDPNNQIKGNASASLSYTLSSSDVPGQWRLRVYSTIGFGPYGFRIELRTPGPPGGGCPILLVWNGSSYIDYGIINIHNKEGDIIKEVLILTKDVNTEHHTAKLRLREGWEGLMYSHSSIDQVKLYAVDKNGNGYLCPLMKAIHSEQGDIFMKLLFSDDRRTDIYLMETIDLKFIVPYPKEAIQKFMLIIEGHNAEKEPW